MSVIDVCPGTARESTVLVRRRIPGGRADEKPFLRLLAPRVSLRAGDSEIGPEIAGNGL